MTLPWSARQVEWLQAMGVEVLARPSAGFDVAMANMQPSGPSTPGAAPVPAALARVARGVDLGPLLAAHGPPTDIPSRRAFWRALRPLRRAARR